MEKKLRLPTSIYRLQLHQKFNFRQAAAVLPYLKELGIEAIYCSPFFKACSPHGYDITDPSRFNPLIGTEKDFLHLCAELKKHQMEQIIDIVPNHMGICKGENRWWQEVLKRGKKSPFASFFDIDWESEKPALKGKVLLPLLGASYAACLKRKEIVLCQEEGEFFFRYLNYTFPIAPETYPLFIDSKGARKERMQNTLQTINRSSRRLHALLERQHYRLASFRAGGQEVNYRRFFNFNDLVALRIEREEVLQAHHRKVFDLARKKLIQGIRIDHPDGLYDPKRYLERVKEETHLPLFLEKILDPHEKLPEEWPVEGTVGYDFLNCLTALFVDKRQEKAISAAYERFVKKRLDFGDLLYEKKKFFAKSYMGSELRRLGRMLEEIAELEICFRDLTRRDLTEAVTEVIACFPVYRTYIGPKTKSPSKRDESFMQEALQRARKRNPKRESALFQLIEELLMLRLQGNKSSQRVFRRFVLRFQQFTGPIMARGLEDISFYLYNRLLSLNEVGGDPRHFGISAEEFHQYAKEKHHRWPHTVLATSTHDTKRSEDVRMRLNVLSELPQEWEACILLWKELNHIRKRRDFPGPNTEYFIYQMLVGLWPEHELASREWREFKGRLWNNLLKSIREAREETCWESPDEQYEKCVKHFLFGILDREKNGAFFDSFLPFVKKVIPLGHLNSLSSLVIKLGSPGIVDVYQGNESWNFVWVDPDNRRDVDYGELKRQLERTRVTHLKETGDLKLYLYQKGLRLRREHPALFLDGEYLPIRAVGERAERVVAFMRKQGKKVVLVVAGIFFSQLLFWEETALNLPFGGTFVDLFSEQRFSLKKGKNPLAPLLNAYPFALLYSNNLREIG